MAETSMLYQFRASESVNQINLVIPFNASQSTLAIACAQSLSYLLGRTGVQRQKILLSDTLRSA
jgi:hypothetical protein